MSFDDLERSVFDVTNDLGRKSKVCLDANAHNTLWNTSYTDEKERELEEILALKIIGTSAVRPMWMLLLLEMKCVELCRIEYVGLVPSSPFIV